MAVGVPLIFLLEDKGKYVQFLVGLVVYHRELVAFLEIFIGSIKELEEVGGLGRGESSQGDVVFIWMVFPR